MRMSPPVPVDPYPWTTFSTECFCSRASAISRPNRCNASCTDGMSDLRFTVLTVRSSDSWPYDSRDYDSRDIAVKISARGEPQIFFTGENHDQVQTFTIAASSSGIDFSRERAVRTHRPQTDR